ncbi:MAG: hypothetical protein ACO1SX_11880 [Actinomycetota bacterium]
MIIPRARFCLAALAVTVVYLLPAHARPVAFRNYDQLTREADLVVIASPTATRDTPERRDLPGISPAIPVIGVETTFQVAAMLKGEVNLGPTDKSKPLTLHHYRLPDNSVISPNGPSLVVFNPKDRKQFLMFLKREADGRFSALSGQTDPELSIEPLRWQR